MHVSEDGMVSAVNDEVVETGDEHQGNSNHVEECVPENRSNKHDLFDTPERETSDFVEPVKKCLNQLPSQNKKSLYLLAYIALITTWPVVGPALSVFFRKRFQGFWSGASVRRLK